MLRFADPGGRLFGSLGTNNANYLAYWTDLQTTGGGSASTNNAITIVASGGRVTGTCYRISQGGSVHMYKSLDDQPSWGIAFAFRMNAFDLDRPIAGFRDSTSMQLDIRQGNSGRVVVSRSGTTLATSTRSIPLNSWTHIEFRATINNTTGSFALYLNGTLELSGTSQNTRATSLNAANGVFFGGMNSGGNGSLNLDYDDIVVYDGQANDAAGNPDIVGPIGDCGVSVLLPSAAGASTQFTPDSGSNFARVSDTVLDTTSYVESSTVGDKDTYVMSDLPGTVSAVKSMAVVHYAEKTDVGARQIGSVIRSAATNFTHPTVIDLSNNYVYSFRAWGTNPQTVLPWTVSDINALEAGQVVNT